MNILGQIAAHIRFTDVQPRSPFPGDLLDACELQSMITGVAKDRRQIQKRIGFPQSVSAHRPEREDEGLAGMTDPFLGQIQGVIAFAINLQRRIPDDQTGVVLGQHLVDIGCHGNKCPSPTQPFLKQYLGQRDRRHRRCVQCHRANLLDRHLADQQDGSHRPARGDRNLREN